MHRDLLALAGRGPGASSAGSEAALSLVKERIFRNLVYGRFTSVDDRTPVSTDGPPVLGWRACWDTGQSPVTRRQKTDRTVA